MNDYIYIGTERVDDFFAHHGIKGQKWGVRRFQNPDGSLTSEGVKRYRAANRIRREIKNPTINDVEKIYKSLSDKERRLLTGSADDYFYTPGQELPERSNVAKVSISRDEKGDPVSFTQVYDNGGRHGEIALATRNDEKYRHKGYASAAVKDVMKWYNQQGYKYLDDIFWTARKSNEASISLGKKFGFEEMKPSDIPKDAYDMSLPDALDYTYLRYKKKEG